MLNYEAIITFFVHTILDCFYFIQTRLKWGPVLDTLTGYKLFLLGIVILV